MDVLSVEIATIVFLALSSILSLYLTKNYLAERKRNYLYWSIGLWLFALSDLFEAAFAFGAYSQPAGQAYLFLTAFLTIPIATGSLTLLNSRRGMMAYIAYSAATSLLLIYYTFTTAVGNIVVDSVVSGSIPVSIILWSSAITFPALAIIVAVAAWSYFRTRRKKLLWIILGMLTFASGGVLYVASFPASIYYTEFAGLVMLWLGFFDFGTLRRS